MKTIKSAKISSIGITPNGPAVSANVEFIKMNQLGYELVGLNTINFKSEEHVIHRHPGGRWQKYVLHDELTGDKSKVPFTTQEILALAEFIELEHIDEGT